jgi:hypothetical protein
MYKRRISRVTGACSSRHVTPGARMTWANLLLLKVK